MTIFYISDLHFGHANIINLCNRPFSSVEDMDAAIIERWNAKVRAQDHVYLLGDVAFRNNTPVAEYVRQLKGHKHLIVGNHDASWMADTNPRKLFESVDLMAEIEDGGQKLTLCHYPMFSWIPKTLLVYGHIHNNKHDAYWHVLSTYKKALNASVEVNNYEPVTLAELVENNRRWKAEEV